MSTRWLLFLLEILIRRLDHLLHLRTLPRSMLIFPVRLNLRRQVYLAADARIPQTAVLRRIP